MPWVSMADAVVGAPGFMLMTELVGSEAWAVLLLGLRLTLGVVEQALATVANTIHINCFKALGTMELR